jgi:SAM-dependent methyltransferase
MKTQHTFDPKFEFVSKTLQKLVLKNFKKDSDSKALDIPCGNGRNIFLLSSYFKEVLGVDINQDYIDEILKAKEIYPITSKICLRKVDLSQKNINVLINEYDFICNIQFYNFALIRDLINKMTKNTFLYIETPSRKGGNSNELPNLIEVKSLFLNNTVLHFEHKICSGSDKISFKALIKKQ